MVDRNSSSARENATAATTLSSRKRSRLRKSRLYQVLLSYVTRPALWLFFAGWLLAVYAGFSTLNPQGRWHTVSPQLSIPFGGIVNLQPASVTVQPADSPDASIMTLMIFSFDAIDQLKALGKAPDLPPVDLPAFMQRFPNIEQVQVWGSYQRSGLWESLSRLPNLYSLSLLAAEQLPQDLSLLKRVSSIQQLQIDSKLLAIQPEVLSDLPQLKLLIISDSGWLDDRCLAAIAAHPHLQDLSLQIGRFGRWTDDGFRKLNESRSLRRVWVPDETYNHEIYDRALHLLPSLSVRPATYAANRLGFLLIMLIACMILTFLVAIQLTAQFSQPFSHLTPHFAAPHLWPVLIPWLIMIGLIVRGLLVYQTPFWAALSIGLFLSSLVPGVMSLITLEQHVTLRFGRVGVSLVGVAIVLSFVVPIVIWPQLQLSNLDLLLRGRVPLVSALLAACALLVPFLVGRNISQLANSFHEFGYASVPASIFAWKDLRRNLPSQKPAKVSALPAASHRARPWHRQQFWSRVWLWQSGNQQLLWRVAILMMAYQFLLLLGVRYLNRQKSNAPMELAIFSGMTVCVMSCAAVMTTVISLWRLRRPMFALELLRPVTRTDFVRDLITAIGCSTLPLLVVGLPTQLFSLHLMGRVPLSAPLIFALSGSWIVLWLCSWACTALSMPQKGDLWAMLQVLVIIIPGLIFAAGLQSLIILDALGQPQDWNPLPISAGWTVLLLQLLAGGIAWGLLVWSKHRWSRAEWGRA